MFAMFAKHKASLPVSPPVSPLTVHCTCMNCPHSDKNLLSGTALPHVGLCTLPVPPLLRKSNKGTRDRSHCERCRANHANATRYDHNYTRFFLESARVDGLLDDILTGGGTTIRGCVDKAGTDTMDAICAWMMKHYKTVKYTGGWMACAMDEKAETALSYSNHPLYLDWMKVKTHLSAKDHIEMQLGRRYLKKNVMRRSYVFIWSMVGGKLQQLHGDTIFNSKLISLIAFMLKNRMTRVLTAGDSDLQYPLGYRHYATPDVSLDSAANAGSSAATLACYRPLLAAGSTGERVLESEGHTRPITRGDGYYSWRGGVFAEIGSSVLMPSAVQHQGDASGPKGWVLSIICEEGKTGLQNDTQCFKLVVMQKIYGPYSDEAVDAYYEWWHALYFSPQKAVRDRCRVINLQDHLGPDDNEFFEKRCKTLRARELAGN
jgi:hypothetical protein